MKFFEEFRYLSELRRYEQEGLPPELALRNPVCGDEVRVQVEIRDGILSRYAYQAQGCWPVYGCLQWLGDRFLDRNVSDALEFQLEEFLGQVKGVPGSKRHAFSLAHRAFRRAVTQALMVGPSEKERV